MNPADPKSIHRTARRFRSLLAAVMSGLVSLPLEVRAEDVLLALDWKNRRDIAMVIVVPDEWDGRDYDVYFYHASTKDKAVWFTAQIFDEKLSPKQLAAWLPGHWKEFGIETGVDFSKLHPAKAQVGGRPAVEYAMEGIFSYAGDIENAKGRMGMTVIEIEGGSLVFTWGGEPAKCDQHLDAIVKVMNSIRPKAGVRR